MDILELPWSPMPCRLINYSLLPRVGHCMWPSRLSHVRQFAAAPNHLLPSEYSAEGKPLGACLADQYRLTEPSDPSFQLGFSALPILPLCVCIPRHRCPNPHPTQLASQSKFPNSSSVIRCLICILNRPCRPTQGISIPLSPSNVALCP